MQKPSSRAERFSVTSWELDAETNSVTFHFDCSRFGTFAEKVSFPPLSESLVDRLDPDLAGLLDLLHIALGVSYYKCAAAETIAAPSIEASPTRLEFLKRLYTDGLAEFFFRAGLPYPPATQFTGTTLPARDLTRSKAIGSEKVARSIVAFGGGKDSFVAQAIMTKADRDTELCSVVMSAKVREAITRTSIYPVTFLERQLDPKLREVNEAGAFNGHVPITAINSLMLLIYGYLSGANDVVFANERSADEPTILLEKAQANHQYSKSSFFEKVLSEAVAENSPNAPDYYSVLRPFSEIWIAGKFAALERPFEHFTSCNKNFQIVGENAPRWCGACAKCAFTSLMLACFLDAPAMQKIFPEDFLDKERLLPVYRELCGLTENKPWDCVGTMGECQAAVYHLSRTQTWKDRLVVKTLLPDILKQKTLDALAEQWEDSLRPSERHFVPVPVMDAAHAL